MSGSGRTGRLRACGAPESLLLALAVLLVVGRLAWLEDDALVACRVADNLMAGRGLGFNPGERLPMLVAPLPLGLLVLLRLVVGRAGLAVACAVVGAIVGGGAVWLALRSGREAIPVALASGCLLASSAVLDRAAAGPISALGLLVAVGFASAVQRGEEGRVLCWIAAIGLAAPSHLPLAAPWLVARMGRSARRAGPLLALLPGVAWSIGGALGAGSFVTPNLQASLSAGWSLADRIRLGFLSLGDSGRWDPGTLLLLAAGFLVAIREGAPRSVRLLGWGLLLDLGWVFLLGGDPSRGRLLAAAAIVAASLLAGSPIRGRAAALVAVTAVALGLWSPGAGWRAGPSDSRHPADVVAAPAHGIADARRASTRWTGLFAAGGFHPEAHPGLEVSLDGGDGLLASARPGLLAWTAARPRWRVIDLRGRLDPVLARRGARLPPRPRIGDDVRIRGLRDLESLAAERSAAGRLVEVVEGPFLSGSRLLAAARLALPGQGGAATVFGPPGPDRPPNLVLVVVDTLRADRLGFAGYARPTSPRLDELAARSWVFRTHRAHASRTGPSVASIFTGLDPSRHGVINPITVEDGKGVLAEVHRTLAEELAAAGFDTRGVVTNLNVSPAFGFGQGFASYGFPAGDFQRTTAAELNWHVRDLLRPSRYSSTARLREPFFLYAHYMEPHSGYAAPARARRLLPAPPYEGSFTGEHWQLDEVVAGGRALDPEDADHLGALYDQEVRWVDAAIGELLDLLAAEGLDDRTLVVVTSDHGEELGDHGSVLHGYTLYEEQLRVPLILSDPRRPGAGEVLEATRHVDLEPTVLDLLGLAAPPEIEGRSLVPLLSGGRLDPAPLWSVTRLNAAATVDRRALVEGRWKLVSSRLPVPGLELYDLEEDPGETENLATVLPERRRELEALLDELEGSWPEAVAPTVNLSSDEIEQLRSLGYLQ